MQEVTEEALFLFHTHTHLVMHVTPHTRTVTRIDHTHTLLIKVFENISDTSSLALLWAWKKESVIPSSSRNIQNHGEYVLCRTWEFCEVHGKRGCCLKFVLCCVGKADGDWLNCLCDASLFLLQYACDLFKYNHLLSHSAHDSNCYTIYLLETQSEIWSVQETGLISYNNAHSREREVSLNSLT